MNGKFIHETWPVVLKILSDSQKVFQISGLMNLLDLEVNILDSSK